MSDDFDDYPQTSLDDEAYDQFVKKNFRRDGAERSGPPVGLWIAGIGLLVLILAVYLLT